jgi:hypothetical protein
MRKPEALLYRQLVHELFFLSISRDDRSFNLRVVLVGSYTAGRARRIKTLLAMVVAG